MKQVLSNIAALALGTVLVTGAVSAAPVASATAPGGLDRFDESIKPVHYRGRYERRHAYPRYRYGYYPPYHNRSYGYYPYAYQHPYAYRYGYPYGYGYGYPYGYGYGPSFGFGFTVR